MKELSLHILDIIQNSVVAGASLVNVSVIENLTEEVLQISVSDNGKGMSEEFAARVVDPFTTGRTTRRVGLGIPLFKLAAENTGGGLKLSTTLGEGTTITAEFGYKHIDRQPLGDMAETMLGVITSYEETDFVYTHKYEDKEFTLDTRELKQILGDVSFKEPEVLLWLSGFLKENEEALYA